MSTVDLDRDARSPSAQRIGTTWSSRERAYRVHIAICPDDVEGFYAYAISIPGIVGEGDTVEAAIENIREAAHATISTYLESGDKIPHVAPDDELPRGCKERWILVNV